MLLPALQTAYLRHAETLAHLRLAETALVIEQFRLSHDRLPSDLTELVPSHFRELPTDPFDGSPLRYNRLASGYLIYSVGQDGRDNGGKAKSFSSSRTQPEDTILRSSLGTDFSI